MVAEGNEVTEVVVVVPVNIALIKYWGKRDEELMLPLNDSVSVSINDLCAETRLRIGPKITEDSVSINGVQIDLSKYQRFSKCFTEIRRIIRKRKLESSSQGDENGEAVTRNDCMSKYEIVSETSFPVGAGLASSAAGFAAIAFALGQLFDLARSEVIRIARQGSGSACRSVLSGFVHWKAGVRPDGLDCVCETIAPEDHWKSLRAIILVTSREIKDIGSTNGMQTTVESSDLLQYRVTEIVPKRVEKLIEAIKEKNFEELAKIVIAESNQLHAVCMDTTPPIKYLNDHSWHLIRLVHAINEKVETMKLAYTFDAGPNCTLFLEEDFVPQTLATIKKYCHLPADVIEQVVESAAGREFPDLKSKIEDETVQLDLPGFEPVTNVVKDVFLSHVGAGPYVLDS